MKLWYDSIGNQLTVNVPLTALSGRDKVMLCKQLMDDLGITARIVTAPDAWSREMERIITEQWDANWNDSIPGRLMPEELA